MNLRPEDIRSKEFPLRRQGYDKDLVDEFMRELCDALQARAEATAAENVFLQVDGGFKSLMQMASETADRVTAEAEAEVQRVRAEVEAEIDSARAAAARLRQEAEMVARAAQVEAEEVLEQARREAQARRTAAEADATQIVNDARNDAIHIVNGAQERVDHLRVIEGSVIDCLSKAGTFVEQAKAWLGADEDTGRFDAAMVDVAEDHDDTVSHPAMGHPGNGNGSRGRPARPEWAPPWWSQPEHEGRMTAAPGNGHQTGGDIHPDH
ncbi:MAG: DivIVA domain-containing protein [Acidimicrobiia bacterium]